MIECPECGSENPDDASFCKNCGTKLEDIVQPTREEKPYEEEKEGWSTKKKVGAGALGFFIFIIIIGALVYSMSGPFKGKEEPTDEYVRLNEEYRENFLGHFTEFEALYYEVAGKYNEILEQRGPEFESPPYFESPKVEELNEKTDQLYSFMLDWKWKLQDLNPNS